MESIRRLGGEGSGIGDIAAQLAVLGGFAVALLGLASSRLRHRITTSP